MSSQTISHGDVITAQPRKGMAEGVDVRETTQGLLQKGKDGLRQWENKMEDKIREHPMKSVLIAAGVGAAVGLVLGVVLAKR